MPIGIFFPQIMLTVSFFCLSLCPFSICNKDKTLFTHFTNSTSAYKVSVETRKKEFKNPKMTKLTGTQEQKAEITHHNSHVEN